LEAVEDLRPSKIADTEEEAGGAVLSLNLGVESCLIRSDGS